MRSKKREDHKNEEQKQEPNELDEKCTYDQSEEQKKIETYME